MKRINIHDIAYLGDSIDKITDYMIPNERLGMVHVRYGFDKTTDLIRMFLNVMKKVSRQQTQIKEQQ